MASSVVGDDTRSNLDQYAPRSTFCRQLLALCLQNVQSRRASTIVTRTQFPAGALDAAPAFTAGSIPSWATRRFTTNLQSTAPLTAALHAASSMSDPAATPLNFSSSRWRGVAVASVTARSGPEASFDKTVR
jgi:hypothetical protein